MKAEIESFKSKNGNVNYTVKELLFGVNAKLDRIEEKVFSQYGRCTNIFLRKQSFNRMIMIIMMLLGGLASVVFAYIMQ